MWWTIAAAIPVLCAGLWLSLHGALAGSLRFYVSEYVNAGGNFERIHPKISGFPNLLDAMARFPENLFQFHIWASIVGAALLALVVVFRWRRLGQAPLNLLLLGLAWGCSFLAVLVQPDRSHVLQNGPPLYIAGTVALFLLELEIRPRRRPRFGPALAAILLTSLVVENLFAPNINSYYTGSIRMRFGPHLQASLPHASANLEPWIAEEYDELLDFVGRNSTPGDGLATCFCLPMLNFMSERNNATGLDILFPHTVGRPDQQESYINRLQQVRFFIANNCEFDHNRPAHCPESDHTLEDFAPAIVEHIQTEWLPVYTSKYGFVTVYERR